MTLHLFTARRSCHDVGVCQRTGPHCSRACHLAGVADTDTAPIGYEAARTAQVIGFPARGTAPTPRPENRDEAMDAQQRDAEWLLALAMRTGVAALMVLVLLALVGLTLASPGSWLHNMLQHLDRLAWAAASVWG